MRAEAWQGEAALGLALLATAAAFAWLGFDMPVGDFAMPGPSLFPLILASLLAIAGIGVAARSIALRFEGAEIVALFPVAVVVTLVALLGCVALWIPLGSPLAFGLFLAVLFRMPGGARWTVAVPAGFVVGVAAWLFFTELLGVRLPTGP